MPFLVFILTLLVLASVLPGHAAMAAPAGAKNPVSTSAHPLEGYPGVLNVERHDGLLRVEVSRSFAESLDDRRHDDWLSGVFGRYDAIGKPLTGVWELVRQPGGGLEPLDRLLPHPVLPDYLKGLGALSCTQSGSNRVMRYPLPLPFGGGLDGKTIVVSPGHGLLSDAGEWKYQRSNLKFEGCAECRGLREDLFTSELVHRYLIPLLVRAGARVYTPREWDPSLSEVIVDDSDSGYEEEGTGWVQGSSAGGFLGGYRVLAPGMAGSARFQPDLPSEGLYWVSVRYVAGTNRSTATRFSIDHAGGTDELVVDQRQDNDRWFYLGQFQMRPGAGHGVRVEPTDGDPGHLIADAVRFGGGVHVDANHPRWHMSAREHLPYVGAPAAVYSSGDVVARPLFAEWQGADAYLSVHSNATGTVNTVSGTSTYRYNCGTYADHSSAPDPSACDDPPGSDALQRSIQQGVVQTLRAEWDSNWRDQGRRVANFGEVRVLDQIPGALVELAFHDNTVTPGGDNPPKMPDNRALQEPEWRRLAAWGLYKGLLEFLNKDGALAPRPPRIESVVTESTTAGVGVRVRWQPVDDAQAYRVYVARGGRGFDGNLVVDGTDVLLDAAPGEPVYVQVSALNAGGESLASEVLGAASQQGLADFKQILVVQGFDREDAWTGEGGNMFDYVFAHGEAIVAAGWGFHSTTNEAVIDDSIPLAPYRIVNWILGEESSGDATFDATERGIVESYVQGGGKILATGAEIGWDLVERGDSSAFLLNVFGAAYQKDDSEDASLVAVPGGVLGDLTDMHLDDGTQGSYLVDYPDVFENAVPGALSAIGYGNGEGAAVAYDNGTTRTFLAGFPIEAVQPPSARIALVASILNYLEPDGPPDPVYPDGGVDAQEPVDGGVEPEVDAGAGGSGPDAAQPQPGWQATDSGEGCACTMPQSAPGETAWWMLGGLGIVGLGLRRRGRRAAPSARGTESGADTTLHRYRWRRTGEPGTGSREWKNWLATQAPGVLRELPISPITPRPYDNNRCAMSSPFVVPPSTHEPSPIQPPRFPVVHVPVLCTLHPSRFPVPGSRFTSSLRPHITTRCVKWDLHPTQSCLLLLVAALFSLFVMGCGDDGLPSDATNATPTEDAGVDVAVEAPEKDAAEEADVTVAPPVECKPKTCAQLDANCGSVPDGCDGKIECGECPAGQICGGGGPNVCGSEECLPKTCVQVNAQCGWASDGCSMAMDCGSCAPPQTCGGAGEPNVCGCTAKSCSQLGANCGTLPDGCEGTLSCGSCSSGQTCGGGGPNVCGSGDCVEKTCSQVGASCGLVSDGCSDVLYCGECVAPNVCGGAGLANECGCTPKTCSQLGASCGTVDTGCGQADCGSCMAPDTCGGGGVENQCGCTCTLPNASTNCLNGVCSIVTCDTGFEDCDKDSSTGCEAELAKSTTNCGSCGKVCSYSNASPSCVGGVCGIAQCNSGWSDCDGNATNGCEVNLSTSVTNCGSCGKVCSFSNASPSCVGGVCGIAQCNSGWGNCDGNATNGCEVNLTTSVTNCGSCGKTCSFPNASASCSSGTCKLGACKTGYANCDGNATNGCEANLATSNSHCGACGRVCSNQCVDGTCEYTSADTARKWDQTYRGNGEQRTDVPSYNYQGYYSSTWGVQKSAIGAPDKMFTDLSGATVLDIWVYLHSPHWYYYAGGTARIGVHGNSTKPATFPGINQDYSVDFARDEGKWVRLPSTWYASFKSGAYRGITIHAANSSAGQYYGYFTASATKWRWKYRK
jgi:N-acetylmuramoyl-L-alanine amidase